MANGTVTLDSNMSIAHVCYGAHLTPYLLQWHPWLLPTEGNLPGLWRQ